MKLRLIPPPQGATWVSQSVRVFARQPIGFATLFAFCLFVLLVLSIVPLAGKAALLLLSPAGTLLFMIATRLAVEAKPVVPGALFAFFGIGRRAGVALVVLGVAYLAAGMLTFWLCGMVDGGSVEALLASRSDPKTTPEAAAAQLADPHLQVGLVLRLLVASALSIPFWHAPALVHWGGQSVPKALFSSSVAIWRNMGAFTAYGLAWAALCFVLLVLGAAVLALVGPQAVVLVAAPITLLMLTLLYISLYFTFADCFVDDAGQRAASAGGTS